MLNIYYISWQHSARICVSALLPGGKPCPYRRLFPFPRWSAFPALIECRFPGDRWRGWWLVGGRWLKWVARTFACQAQLAESPRKFKGTRVDCLVWSDLLAYIDSSDCQFIFVDWLWQIYIFYCIDRLIDALLVLCRMRKSTVIYLCIFMRHFDCRAVIEGVQKRNEIFHNSIF